MPTRTPRLPPEVRRRELLDAALDVLTDGGFDALNVGAVASRAGVTRPVVYDQFGDLDGLVLALLDREEQIALEGLLEIVGGDPGDVAPEVFLHDGVLAFLEAVHANPRTWRLVLMPPRGRSQPLRERIAATRALISDRVAELLAWGIERRGGPHGLDLELFARVVVATGEDAARLSLVAPGRYPPARIAGLTRDAIAALPAGTPSRGTPLPAALAAAAPVAEPSPLPVPAKRLARADRREHLLDVSLDLIARDGFDALSMEAVAREAGVNRAIVYRSFANLGLLLLALLRREDARTRSMLDALLPTSTDGRAMPELLTETLAAFLDAVVRHPRTYRVVLQRPESSPLILRKLVNRRRADLAKRLRPFVEWGTTGVDADLEGVDADVLARLLLSAGEELGRLALDDPAFPPARILGATWALLDHVPLR